jgi:hypothetical protein
MWITYFPFIVVTILVLAGFILLFKGLRGRRIAHAPRCRKCRYDLTGLTSARCPECGGLVAEVGVITHHRQRYPGYILASLVLLLPLIGALIMAGRRIEYYFDGYHYKPTAWVIDDAASGNPRLSQYAYRELTRRLRRSGMSADNARRLKQQVMKNFQAHGLGRYDAASDVAAELLVKGHFTAAETATLLETNARLAMDARETALLRYGIPVRIRYDWRLPSMHFSVGEVLFQLTEPGDTTTVPTLAAGQQWRSLLEMSDHLVIEDLHAYAHKLQVLSIFFDGDGDEAFRVQVPETGEYDLHVAVRVDFMARNTSPPTLIHTMVRRFQLTSSVVEEPPPGDIKLLTDPELGEKIRQTVTLQLGVPELPLRGEPEDYVHFHLLFDRAPVAIAYNLITVVQGMEHARENSGHLVPQGRGVARTGPKAVPQPRPEKITYILRPDPALVYQAVDIDEVWGEPIEFRDLTVPPPATRTDP